MKKNKYVFISNMASPYQVKFCYSLQEHFDTEFWFYEHIGKNRPKWWKIPLGDKCKILKYSGQLPKLGYFSFGIFKELNRFKPDIIALGGYMNWHWFVLKWAKHHDVKVVVMSEPFRYMKGKETKKIEIWNKTNSSKRINYFRKLFDKVDLHIGMGSVAEKQFVEEFEFPREKVAHISYPQDIEEYYNHPLRVKNYGDHYQLLFANRLIERYQPLIALETYKKLQEIYPQITMYMNNDGDEKQKCEEYIEINNLKGITFLDDISSWNDMHLIYKNSDILILPASYSNGNGTIIEARASGMGIVVSNQINHLEQHSFNNENCFICNPTSDDFVTGIMEYINSPEILISHGMSSRKSVEYKKNESLARDYYNLYSKYGIVKKDEN